jgi:hypothetical protein
MVVSPLNSMFDEAFLVTEKFKANENCKPYFFIVVINQRI